MPGCPIVDAGRVDFLDHSAFHLHIDLKVNVGGVDVCVPQPIADQVDLVPGAQQVHRSGMAKGVGRNGFSLDRWALMCRNGAYLPMIWRMPKRVIGTPLAFRNSAWVSGCLGWRSRR